MRATIRWNAKKPKGLFAGKNAVTGVEADLLDLSLNGGLIEAPSEKNAKKNPKAGDIVPVCLDGVYGSVVVRHVTVSDDASTAQFGIEWVRNEALNQVVTAGVEYLRYRNAESGNPENLPT